MIEQINEQLLRAVGVGIALFDATDLRLKFSNEVFNSWFGEAGPEQELGALFPDLDIAALRGATDGGGRYDVEVRFRKKRRTLVIAQTMTRARVGDSDVIILECQNISRIRELESMIASYSSLVERNSREIQREKEQVEKLLLNIMPKSAYEEYRNFGAVAPQRYDEITVLVLDFVDFAERTRHLAPASFVGELNELYSAFDQIGEQFGCERIKTTGDTYLCVAGMHDGASDHTAAMARAAIRFVRYLKRRNENAEIAWECRIGISVGPAVGSVVGVKKYVFDVFGPAVNEAYSARALADAMEVVATAGSVARLSGDPAVAEPRLPEAKAAGLAAIVPV